MDRLAWRKSIAHTLSQVAKTVFGVFQNRNVADAAAANLIAGGDGRAGGGYSVQTHTAGPIDTSVLPDSATETGRNTTWAIGIGAAVGAMLGVGLGSGGVILGLGAGLGAMLGLLVGVLSGLLCGMMAGTRRPKLRLRRVAQELAGEQVLLTLEAPDRTTSESIQAQLQSRGAVDFGEC